MFFLGRKLVSFSLDGSVKAVFTKFKPKKSEEEKEIIEVHSVAGKIATNDLAATKRHGKLYTDGQFLSPCFFSFFFCVSTIDVIFCRGIRIVSAFALTRKHAHPVRCGKVSTKVRIVLLGYGQSISRRSRHVR